jgi:hypothetical protein
MTDEELLKLFGLRRHPFAGPWRDALTPSAADDECRLYAKIDGFGRALPQIHAWCLGIKDIEPETCAFVLIHGRKGCGRTSTANLIAFLILQALASKNSSSPIILEKDAVKKTLVKVPITDDSPIKPIKEAIKNFYLRLLISGVDVRKRDPDLFAEIKKDVLESREIKELGVYQDLFIRLILVLKEKGSTEYPFFLFEDLKNYAQADTAISIMQEARHIIFTTVMFTTEDSKTIDILTTKFDNQELLPGISIPLAEVASDEIVQLVGHRWAECSPDPSGPMPFEGIADVFSGTFWPIKTACSALDYVFSAHLDRLRTAKNVSTLLRIEQSFLSKSVIEYLLRGKSLGT